MTISREALYLVVGSALLMSLTVLQVAEKNVISINWRDFWITLIIIAGIFSLLIAILAFSFPNRLSIAAAVVLTVWLSTYYVDVGALLYSIGLPAANETGFVTVLVLLFPVQLVVLALLPQEFVARAIGTAGLALFSLAAIQLALSSDPARFMKPAIDPTALIDDSPLPEPARASGRLPDIIYIVPDRYANSGVLADVFQYDNGDFLSALRRRGFAVADKARANYLRTGYSLASSMNMQYLEPVLQRLDGITRSSMPLYSLIRDNLVTARLKRMGYRYIHIPSWWDGTRKSAQADLTVNFTPLNFGGEFGRVVLSRNSFLRLAIESIYPANACDAFKQQLAYLEDVGGDDRPTFVFAHVLAPHSPILTDAEGRCIEKFSYPSRLPGVAWDTFVSGYSGFVHYLNSRLLEIFDKQKSENPNPLIFVLQADEGPYPKAVRENSASVKTQGSGAEVPRFDWREASDAQLAMKFGILNALYLGDPNGPVALPDVPEALTPVNNWRIIFGLLEGKSYPLLPDRNFIIPNSEQPYLSIEITERLGAIAR